MKNVPGIYMYTIDALLAELVPLPSKRPLLIAIDGRPCSGKTTLTAQLEEALQAQVVYLDEFFIPQRQWPANRTPEFPFFYFRYGEFLDGVKALASGRGFRYHAYDWQADDVSSHEICVDPNRVIIIEGVSSLNQQIADLYFKKIWVASDIDTERDAIRERESGNNLDLWMNIYLPSVDLYCEQKPWLRADIIYAGRGSGDISTAITTYKNGVNDMAFHQWQQTIFIDTALAAKLIQQQMALEVKSIVEMGKGWDNIAYLVNKQYVFRFPRRDMGVECLQNEIQVLPYLARHVSFPFTHPEFIGTPTQDYQAPFAGYPMLPGTPLSDLSAKSVASASFAKKLAQWLKALHAIAVRQEDHTAIKGDQNWRYNVSQRSDKVIKSLETYAPYFQDAGFEVSKLVAELEYFKAYDFEHIARTSYCHGDLYSRHILVDENHQPSGLIDWGDVHIGHPGIDLAVGIMIFADDALSIFLKEYGHVDDITYAMALFRAFWHPIALLPYCYEEKEERLKEWAALALSRALTKIGG